MLFRSTEGSSVPSEHTLPEAPSKNPSQDKVNSPFTDTAVANGEKEFTKTESNYEKPSGSPYSTATNATLTSDKAPKSQGDNGNAYNDGAKYAPKGAVTNEHPKGGKVTRADESKRTIKLTEEQVLAWSREHDDYMDKSHGTEIGSSAPFDDETDGNSIHEAEGPVFNSDSTLYNNAGTGTVAHDGDPFKEGQGSDAEADNGVIAENDFNDEDIAGFDGLEDVNDQDEEDDFFKDDVDLHESEFHDFGKHPAYRKVPMTTPPNKEVAINGAHEWDDESAQGEEPFGKKIGSSAPFEKAVQTITNSIMESLGF